MTPHEFYLKWNGKGVDVDGAYGYQCWDGAMQWMRELGYPTFSCTQSGYAKDIWNLRNSSGILNYCNAVQRPFQDGDIIVWTNCSQCPYSHIAIFRKDNGDGTFVVLGQNQGAPNGVFNQINLTYDGVLGGLRPKCLAQSQSTPTQTSSTKKVGNLTVTLENGTATFTTGPINVRDGSPTGAVVAQYDAGESVNYWGKYVGNGHRYVVYTSNSGKTRFVAISGSEKYGVDKWAECK